MAKAKKINCKFCGMGDAPRSDGDHWIVKSIFPARITIAECAYHKAGKISPIQKIATVHDPVGTPGSGS